MRPRFSAAVLLVGLSILPFHARAQDAEKPRDLLWKVSCTAGGKVVFVAMVPAPEIDKKSYEVTSKYPGAACVFIPAADPNAPPDPEGVTAVPFENSPVSPEIDSPLSTGTPGLDTALRALRGDRVTIAMPPLPAPLKVDGRKAGEIFATVPVDPVTAPPPAPVVPPEDPSTLRPKGGDWVRLSLYSGAGRMDAISDWQRIVAQDRPIFASLTPSVVETKDYVMLTAGPVAPDERVDVCMSALSLGVDCVFGDEEKIDSGSLSMDDFLSASGGDLGNEADQRVSPAVMDAMDACGSTEAQFDGRQCWRSSFAMAQDHALSIGETLPPEAPARLPVPRRSVQEFPSVSSVAARAPRRRKPRPPLSAKASDVPRT